LCPFKQRLVTSCPFERIERRKGIHRTLIQFAVDSVALLVRGLRKFQPWVRSNIVQSARNETVPLVLTATFEKAIVIRTVSL